MIENNGDAEARKCAERALNLRPAGEEAKKIIEILWKRAEKLKVRLSSIYSCSAILHVTTLQLFLEEM